MQNYSSSKNVKNFKQMAVFPVSLSTERVHFDSMKSGLFAATTILPDANTLFCHRVFMPVQFWV